MIGVILVFVNSSSSVYVKIFMLGAMSLASLILFWAIRSASLLPFPCSVGIAFAWSSWWAFTCVYVVWGFGLSVCRVCLCLYNLCVVGVWLGWRVFHVWVLIANWWLHCAVWMPSIYIGVGLCGSLMIILSLKIICPSVKEWLVNACKVILSKYLWYCVVL